MQTVIRAVEPDDWPLLRTVRLRALADATDAFASTLDRALALTDTEWRERAQGNGLTLLALADGQAVAMGGVLLAGAGAGAGAGAEGTAYVWGMWTAPEARGRGLGGRMLDELVEWSRTDERATAHNELRLHVTEGNDTARALYVGRGFRPTGSWEPLRDGSSLQVEELRLSLR